VLLTVITLPINLFHCTNNVFLKMLHFPFYLICVILKIILYFCDVLATPRRIAYFQKLKPNHTLPMRDSGFRREADKNCTLLPYYAASSGNFLPTFWNNLSVPSSRAKILTLEKCTSQILPALKFS